MGDEPKQKATYVVLEASDLDAGRHGLWREVGRYEANGTDQAVRLHIAGRKALAGARETYVAIAERYFQPVTPVTEQKPVTKLVPYTEPVEVAEQTEEEHAAAVEAALKRGVPV